MDRAADLFIEQNIPAEAGNIIIRAKSHFAQSPRSFVHIQQRVQQILALRRSRLDNPAVLKPQTNVFNLAPGIDSRETVADIPLGRGFITTGEDLAIGKVTIARTIDPGAPGNAIGQVGIGRNKADNTALVEQIGNPLLLSGCFAPFGTGSS